MGEIKKRVLWDGDCYIYQVLVDGKVVLSSYTPEECEERIENLKNREEVRDE